MPLQIVCPDNAHPMQDQLWLAQTVNNAIATLSSEASAVPYRESLLAIAPAFMPLLVSVEGRNWTPFVEIALRHQVAETVKLSSVGHNWTWISIPHDGAS